MAAFLTYVVTTFTNRHLLQVQMLHDITNKKQGIYTSFAFGVYLPTRTSRCSVKNVDASMLRGSEFRRLGQGSLTF
ncbi:hypothetical protein [Bradyrhizobium sp. USDA 4473]